MTHLTVRTWALLAGATIDLPADTRCCDGVKKGYELVSSGRVGFMVPTCPECSMIRESLLLALEHEATK